MSRQVDSYVASMEFDNSRFEKNVSTTMSTLDKLKQKLSFSGASKGLENIEAASSKCTMSGFSGAIDSVKVKFSALEVMAVTALTNITNKAVNAGEQLVKSLSVDQITAGWEKYGNKTTSVATLVAQGNAIEDVNEQLSMLNWYTDETSYNFTDMVANISKFTATGKGLEDSVTAMEGIANWAALSGQNATTASRAMYQLAQALGAGYMRLEDYKSIQNASMDTMEFREKTIEAAIALGTLKDNGDGTYSSLVEGASDTSWTISQFASNLTDGMWFTSDVMMEVFTNYANAVSGIYEATESTGKLASEVIDEVKDKADELKTSAMTDEEAVDAAIKALGYTLEDGSLMFDSFGIKAFEAAQKARTFRDAIDATKDAVSTGWMNTFELIFGDANEATELWTDLANTLYDVFAEAGNVRNEILEKALGKSLSSIGSILTTINKGSSGLKSTLSSVSSAVSTITEPIKTVTKTLEDYNNVVDEVIRGEWGHVQERWDALTEAGYDWITVQNMVNEKLGNSYRRQTDFVIGQDSVTEAIQGTTEAAAENAASTEDATKVDSAYLAQLAELSKAELEQLGLYSSQISALKQVKAEADKLGISVEDFIDNIDEIDGRWILINSFKNVWAGLVKVFEAVRDAWEQIFPPKSTTEKAEALYNILAAVHKFTTKLIMSEETAAKVTRTFKGLFAIFEIIRDVVSGALSAGLEILGEIIGSTNTSVLDVTGSIGDALVVVRNLIKENNLITKGFELIVSAAKKVINVIKRWITAFKNIPTVSEFLEQASLLINDINSDANKGTRKIQKWVDSFNGMELVNAILEKLKAALQWIGNFVSKTFDSLKKWFNTFKETEGVKQLIEAVTELYNALVKLFKGEIDANEFAAVLGNSLANILMSLPKMAVQIGKDFMAGFSNGITDGIKDCLSNILEFCATFISSFSSALGVHSPSIIAYAIGAFFIAGFIKGLQDSQSDLLSKINQICDGIIYVFKSFWNYLSDESGNIDWDKIFAGGVAIGSLVIVYKLAEAFQTIANAFTSVSSVISAAATVEKKFAKVLEGVSWDLKAQAVLKMAIAVGILALAIYALAQIEDPKKLVYAVAAILVMAGIVAGLALALNKLGTASVKFDKANGTLDVNGFTSIIIQIGLAMLALAAVMKIIGSMEAAEVSQGLKVMGVLVAGMLGFLAVMGLISKYADASKVSGMGGMMVKLAASMVLMVGVCKLAGSLSGEQMLKGVAFATAFALFVMAISSVAGKAGENVGKVGWMVLQVSAAMLLMVGVCKLVGKLTPKEMWKGAAFAVAFGAFVVALVAFTKMDYKKHVESIGGVMLGIAVALLAMVAVCKLAGTMTIGELIKGLACVAVLTLLIKSMIKILKVGDKTEMVRVGGTIIAMTTAISIMAAIAVILGMIPVDQLKKGIAAVSILGLIMAVMVRQLRGATNAVGAITAMAVVIGVIVGCVAALTLIDDTEKLKTAATCVGLLMGMLALMSASLNRLKPLAKGEFKKIWNLTAMAIPLAAFAAVIFALSVGFSLTKTELATDAVIALVAVMTTMVLLLGVLHKINYSKNDIKKIWNLTAMAIPLTAFAAVIFGLSAGLSIPSINFATDAVIALVAVMTTMVLLLGVLHKINYSKNDIKKIWNLTAMAVPLTAFAAVLWGLSALGVETSVSTILALVGIATACTLLLFPLTLIGKLSKSGEAYMGVLALLTMAVPLAAFAGVLMLMNFAHNALDNVIALTVLATACTALLIPLTIIGAFGMAGLPYLGALALLAMAVPLVAFAGILMLMGNVQNAITNAEALVVLVTACSLMLIPLSLVGALGMAGLPYLGVLALLAMAVPMLAFVGVLALMDNIKNATANANLLIDLTTTLTEMLVKLSLVAPLAIVGVAAMVALTALIVAVGVLAVGIGAVMEWFPDLESFLYKGLPILEDISTSLGTIIGNFIGAIGESLSASMIVISENLTATMEELSRCSDAAEGINGENFKNLDGIQDFLLVLAEIGVSSIIDGAMDGISKFLSGKTSIEKFVDDAKTFFSGMKEAMSPLQGVTFNETALDCIIKFTKKLAGANTVIGGSTVWTGITDFLTLGDSTSMEKFTTDATTFFSGMKTAMSYVTGVTLDEEALDCIIKFATELARASIAIGGATVWTGIMDLLTLGGTSMEKFTEDAKTFFSGMRDAMKELNGVKFNEQGLTCVMDFAERLAGFESNLDGLYSFIEWVTGHSDLDVFRQNAGEFFASMRDAMRELNGVKFNEQGLTCVMNFAERLAAFESSLDGMYGFIEWITNRTDLDIFRKNAKEFFRSMRDAMQLLDGVTFNEKGLNYLMDFAERLGAFQSSLDGVYNFIDWCVGLNASDLDIFRVNARQFVFGMMVIMSMLDGVTFNEEGLNYLMDFAERLGEFQSSLDGVYSFIDWCVILDASDLDIFRLNACEFILAMTAAMALLTNVTFNETALDYLIDFSARLADFQKSLDGLTSFITWITGVSDLTLFGTNAALFIGAMKAAMLVLGDTTFNEDALTSVINAAERLAEFQNTLEPMGGVMDWFCGRDDIGTFGTKVGEFATAMSKLKEGMGESGISDAVISSVVKAGEAIVELQKVLPEESWFDGKMNLSEFSDYVEDFGTAMATFSNKGLEVDLATVSSMIDTAYRVKTLIESLVDLDTSGVETFTGIGSGWPGADGPAYDIARAIAKFGSEVKNIDPECVTVAVSSAERLKRLIANLVGLDISGIENFKPQNIGGAMKDYGDKVKNIDPELVASSVTSANSLRKLIVDLGGLDTSGISNFNVASIGASLRDYSSNVSKFNASKVEKSITQAERLKTFVSSLASINTSGVSAFKTALTDLGSINIKDVVSTFNGLTKELSTSGANAIKGYIEGMESKKSNMIETAKSIANASIKAFDSKNDEFKEVGKQYSKKVASGIKESKKDVKSEATNCSSEAKDAVRDTYDSWYDAGKYLASGLKDGISSKSNAVVNAAVSMAKAAMNAVRSILKINSPSKVFREIGSGVPEGFAMGIGMLGNTIDDSVTDMTSTAVNTARSSMATILDAINSDMDVQPTIRPVVDLSDVKTGLSAIDGLFSSTQSVGIQSNLSAVNLAMNRKGQNGNLDEVISAIDKLNNSLEDVKGDTYTIGDITYSSNDEISKAVQDLVRAAILGRRV